MKKADALTAMEAIIVQVAEGNFLRIRHPRFVKDAIEGI
jgi:hypothetical protein